MSDNELRAESSHGLIPLRESHEKALFVPRLEVQSHAC